jgi:hypothetical protein
VERIEHARCKNLFLRTVHNQEICEEFGIVTTRHAEQQKKSWSSPGPM